MEVQKALEVVHIAILQAMVLIDHQVTHHIRVIAVAAHRADQATRELLRRHRDTWVLLHVQDLQVFRVELAVHHFSIDVALQGKVFLVLCFL